MALFGTLNKVSKNLGSAIGFAASFAQNQMLIESVEKDKEDSVLLNVTENISYSMETTITDKPVADLGASSDYIDRKPTILQIEAVISNRTLNLKADPAEAIAQRVRGLFPSEALAVVNASVSAASLFLDLGKDEMDRKLGLLRKWQLFALPVKVLFSRIDPQKITPLSETVFMLIESITPAASSDIGDGLGVAIRLKELLNIQTFLETSQQGSQLTDTITGALNLPNPFG